LRVIVAETATPPDTARPAAWQTFAARRARATPFLKGWTRFL
jgi:hypothetical protein